jgi:hypothetical protein
MNSNDKPPFYECQYCGKKLLKESSLLKHSCAQMEKMRICKTRKGTSAFNDYKTWLSFKLKTVSKLETFVDSKFFNTFVKFQDFAASKGIPDRKAFMRYMVQRNMPPTMWQSDDTYDAFILHYDATVSPMAMVKTTLSTMQKLATILECDINQIFDDLLPAEVAKLIFERRLSPWVLLLSKKFTHYLHMLKDPSQYVMITTVIDVDDWHLKFKKNPTVVAEIKTIITELDL